MIVISGARRPGDFLGYLLSKLEILSGSLSLLGSGPDESEVLK